MIRLRVAVVGDSESANHGHHDRRYQWQASLARGSSSTVTVTEPRRLNLATIYVAPTVVY